MDKEEERERLSVCWPAAPQSWLGSLRSQHAPRRGQPADRTGVSSATPVYTGRPTVPFELSMGASGWSVLWSSEWVPKEAGMKTPQASLGSVPSEPSSSHL